MKKETFVERALGFIEENLTRDISLENIADAANYSQWYFHRSFRVLTGYALFDYLRRRRLSEAAYELLYTTKSILQIALLYQFESQASFTRSFKALSGLTPGKYRRIKALPLAFHPISVEKTYRYLKQGASKMQVKFEKKEGFKVIGLSHRASPEETMHKLWEEYARRCHEIPNVIEKDKAYQICVFEPRSGNADPESYLFIAGMVVSSIDQVPEGMVAHEVPAAQYAIFEHKGALDTLHKTYEYIFGAWLAENKCVMAEADCLEVYDERFKYGEEDSILDIYIPITKL